MRYLSLCSGIEAATVAWEPMGWKPAAFAEIEPFPSAVLAPTECERLQGFPDGYTAVPYRGKPAADGPRYKALGNSWACNVARWVGRRIEWVEQIADGLDRVEAAE